MNDKKSFHTIPGHGKLFGPMAVSFLSLAVRGYGNDENFFRYAQTDEDAQLVTQEQSPNTRVNYVQNLHRSRGHQNNPKHPTHNNPDEQTEKMCAASGENFGCIRCNHTTYTQHAYNSHRKHCHQRLTLVEGLFDGEARADEEGEEDVKENDQGDLCWKWFCELGAALQLQDDVENDHRYKRTDVDACRCCRV